MTVLDGPRSFAFIFPMASGHINPSLPLARALVKLGHQVHFLCREQMRAAIEGTGAVFHSEIELQPELYSGREPDLFGAYKALSQELGLEGESQLMAMIKVRHINLELQMPGTIRWLRAVAADAVVYCPLSSLEAGYGAEAVGIPSVGLLTTAGPGSLVRAFEEFFKMSGITVEELRAALEVFEPHLAATKRLNEQYRLNIPVLPGIEPFGKSDTFHRSLCTLVTTCEDLQDPMPADLAEAYAREGAVFEALGPLLDEEGAVRAAGHKFKDHAETTAAGADSAAGISSADPVELVTRARAEGRRTVFMSMGTVITGDHPMMGWNGRISDKQGEPHGLTGRQLCQAAWAGAFDAFGEASPEAGALLVVALGPQPDALEGLEVPANAVCWPVVPQVDVLRAGIDLFLTHGGQNSFTEALNSGTPVVVCPGFGDQVVNAQKACSLGVGLQVARPEPALGTEAAAAALYRGEVAAALRRVASDEAFGEAAGRCAMRLQAAGGVRRAVEVLLGAAGAVALPEVAGKLQAAEEGRAEVVSFAGGA